MNFANRMTQRIGSSAAPSVRAPRPHIEPQAHSRACVSAAALAAPRERETVYPYIAERSPQYIRQFPGDKLQHVAEKRHYAHEIRTKHRPSGDQNARTLKRSVTRQVPRARSVDAYAEDAPLLGLPLSRSPPRVIWGGTISSGRPTSASPQPRSRRPAQWWCRRSEAVDPMGQAAALLCQGLHNCVPEVMAVRAEGGSPTCHRLQPRS